MNFIVKLMNPSLRNISSYYHSIFVLELNLNLNTVQNIFIKNNFICSLLASQGTKR